MTDTLVQAHLGQQTIEQPIGFFYLGLSLFWYTHSHNSLRQLAFHLIRFDLIRLWIAMESRDRHKRD